MEDGIVGVGLEEVCAGRADEADRGVTRVSRRQ